MQRVCIPIPQQIPHGKGITAARSGGEPFSVRLALAEHWQIERVIARLGMTKSNFVRWCAVMVAKTLEEEHVQHEHNDRARED